MHQHRRFRHHRLHLAFPTALAIVFALGTGLPGASAADKPKPGPAAVARITFGAQPATKGAPDKRPNYRYAVTPGGTLRDEVAVRNLSTSAVTLRVYATDALNINNGGFGLLPRAQRPRDVGTWVTINGREHDGTVSVKARSVKILTLSLKVPRNAQPGDHTGGIIAAVTTVSKNKTGTAANVELDQRVGVRLFVRVSGPLHPSLTVKPIDANYQNILNPFGRGATKVTYRITNTGNVNMGGRQSLSIKGLVGPAQVLALPDADLLLPGGHIDVKTSLAQTWPLVHENATVTVKPLVLPGDLGAGKATYSAATSFWAVPWSPLALLCLIGLAPWLTRRYRRTRRARGVGAPASATGGVEAGVSQTRASETRVSESRVRETRSSKTRASKSRTSETRTSETGIRQGSARRLAASSALALAAVIAASGTAIAANVPYTDINVTGGITLCDPQGHPKTTGSVGGSLAATVVGGSAAVAPYDGNGRAAVLVAYQPRKGVNPGDWNGQAMTALSRYTDPKHPMVEILPRDYKVKDFLVSYSAQWDGLVQLRIYLRVPNEPTKIDTYAATTLKVTGSTWAQVGASAGAVCTTGHAESVARLLGLPTTAPSAPHPGSVPGSVSGSVSGSPTTRPAGASPSSRPAAGAASSAPSAVSSSPSPSGVLAGGASAKALQAGVSTGDRGGLPTWVLPMVALAAAALLLWLWGRRRVGLRDGS